MLGRLYQVGHGVPQDYSEALRLYRRAVEQNDPMAQFHLGLMYYNGQGVPKDEAEAVKWIRRAADQGDAEAQFEMGGMYSVGAGVPQDYAETARWYRRAAEQGYVDAQFLLWMVHHDGRGVPKDPVEAARWLRMAAEQGHADAQFKLGMLYIEGDGVPEDGAEAVRWLHRAAQQGHAQTLEMFGDTLDELASLDATLEDAGDGSKAQGDAGFNQLLGAAEGGDAEAQYELAVAYAEGRGGVDNDERTKQVLLWATRAANQGHPGAMAEVGSLYMGTDDVMALRWLRPAAAQGHGGAQGNLGYMYQHGHGVPRDTDEAARLYRLAAEQGLAQAQHNLGVMYLHGQGVPKDTAEAARWFRLAADQGHPDAVAALGRTEPAHALPSSPGAEERVDAEEQYRLGQRYRYEVEDYAEAARWYRLAAEQGHAGAQFSLGLIYAQGQGVTEDDTEAARWFRRAAEEGHAGAMYLLGSAYLIGRGVDRDFREAVRWYRLAAENGDDDAKERLESLETWRCFGGTDLSRTNVLLTLSRLEHGGEVSVAGTTYSTQFEVRGLDRRWDFGLDDDGTFDYMFRIEPDGTGLYYDFSRSTDGTAKPSQRFRCEQLPTESAASAVGDDLGDVSGAAFAGRTGTDVRLPSVATTGVPSTCDVESRVDGEFEGWEGDTVVKLTNGQIWEQSEYHYEYSYSYMPRVTIFQSRGQCKMLVDGVDEPVGVSRLR